MNQILDVRVDPEVRELVLSEQVNIVRCPRCGTAQRINMPFIYHDPAREVALLYLPPDAGKNEVERQKVAGKLTRVLLNSLPTEEQKSYLLQPETFLNVESLKRRVLELEGLGEEEINRARERLELLGALVDAAREGTLEQAVAEHQVELESPEFHLLLQAYIAPAMQGEQSEDTQVLRTLLEYLRAHTEMGQKFAVMDRAYDVFRSDPTRENLLALLRVTPSEDLFRSVVENAIDSLDYAFFKALVDKIEQAPTEAERQEWETLRKRILAARDELVQQVKQIYQSRQDLIEKLLETEEVDKMLQSHLSELDPYFAAAMEGFFRQADQEHDLVLVQELKMLSQKVDELIEQQTPPEVAFLQMLLSAPSDAEVKKLLRRNEELLSPELLELLKRASAQFQQEPEGKDPQMIARLAHVVALLEEHLGAAAAAAPQEAQSEGESSLPEGLIFAKH